MEDDIHGEVIAIKSKLDDIHKDVKKFIERSNQLHLASLLNECRSDFSSIILGYATGEIESGLESRMVKDCHMRVACKTLFSNLLKSNVNQIKDGKVSEEAINKTRTKMKGMQDKAPYEQCCNCFSEASRLFDKQIDLMRSLRIYQDGQATKISMNDLPEDLAVSEILEPISSRQRLQILKALSAETKTFSVLSALTGLRGGNLLFHLQKLMESGMMLQRHERGDYMITEKGYKVLRGISELYSELNSTSVTAEPAELST